MDPINVTPFIESFCRHMHLLTVFTDTNKDSIACTHACEIPTLFAETISLFFYLPAPCTWHSVVLFFDKKVGVAVDEEINLFIELFIVHVSFWKDNINL